MKKIKMIIAIFLAVQGLCLGIPSSLFGDEYNTQGQRDPFVPLVGVSTDISSGNGTIMSVNDVSLQGIVMNADGKFSAIINGEVMKEGDSTEHTKIEAIRENAVVIRIEDQSHEIKLYE
ncbi:MAG: general secretion pathway protein GspB [Candidatus Aadella gelida]|nr:general secretion pathway protein GspB [Candidatus Aadella gelida]